MRLIDRNVIVRFLGNFVTLFCLLFIFAVSIDVVLQFDNFVDAARNAVDAERYDSVALATIMAILDFHGPRVFQFFGFMVGLVSVAAAGFTLAQMQRSRELLALLAVGVPLQRVAASIVLVAFLLNGVQVLNQEFVVPELARVLLREHDEVLARSAGTFDVPLTRDGNDNLVQIARLDVERGTAEGFLVLERDDDGTARRRLRAPIAHWDESAGQWLLSEGIARTRSELGAMQVEPPIAVATYATDLSPRAFSVKRFRDHAQMLSSGQIQELRADGGDATGVLARIAWARVGGFGVNMLVLVLAMSSFLRRHPAPLLPQCVQSAAIAVPLLLVAALVMMLPIEGISPAVMAIMPTAILVPIVFWRVAALPT